MVKRTWHRTVLGKLLVDQGRQQRWVANQIGIDEATLSKMLDGRRPCSPERAGQIARLLGISVDIIYRDGELSESTDLRPEPQQAGASR